MILRGHVLDVLRDMESDSVDLVVTSPPYYGHRSYPVPDVVWGGDTNCDHDWSNTIDRVQSVGGNDGVPEDWQRQGRESNTQGNAGNFCTK